MTTNSTHQEVLLITGTTFSSRQISAIDSTSDNKNLDKIEQLEEACVNGLLKEILPEICGRPVDAKKIYLWGIKEGDCFIELDFSEYPEQTDQYFSIDPYSFLSLKNLN
ncbi:MAG TPA: hypothetical protein VNV85_18220 [Puia sp.]|jgi:hypothetical protein|nr:hypothetical protein [Puia sp.]